jgi:hypothetical protein
MPWQRIPELYKSETQSVDSMLSSSGVTYRIPPFQRRYAWRKEEVSQLLNDIYGEVNWAAKNISELPPYFLGSIVLAKGEDDNELLVLDGQQRLTTISLLMAVLRSASLVEGRKEGIDEDVLRDTIYDIDKHLQSGAGGEVGAKRIPKILLQKVDEEDYENLLRNSSNYTAIDSRLGEAVQEMWLNVESHLLQAHNTGASKFKSLQDMMNRLLLSVGFSRIVAESEGAAFELFEALNDRGLGLSAADLVKNKLFARSYPDYYPVVRDIWQNILNTVKAPDLVDFLRIYWIAMKSNVTKQKLFGAYKSYIADLQPNKTVNFATELLAAAKIYKGLLKPRQAEPTWPSEVEMALERLNKYGAKSFRPAVLATALTARDKVYQIASACEVAHVRHRVIQLRSPSELETAYSNFCEDVRQGVKDKNLNIENSIRKTINPLLPSDDEFIKSFKGAQVTYNSTTWRQILIRLDEKVGTGETTIAGPDRVHIEHIFPQNPTPEALAESQLKNIQQKELKKLKFSIGNLTLLDGVRNRTGSNRPFSQKLEHFEGSQIALNKEIAEKKKWTRKDIEARTHKLANLAPSAWPLP